MSKEVTVKQSNQVSTEVSLNEWGIPQQVSMQDVVIPKILPMQGLSQLVTDRKAQMGEFRDSLSGELLGSIDKPMEVIPFFCSMAWDLYEDDGKGQFKWRATVPLVSNPTSSEYNDNWEWSAEENGVRVKRVRRMNFYVLVPSQIKAGGEMPYVLSFKSTSMREGKKLYTQCYVRNIAGGLPPAAFVINLGGGVVKNDKGSFVVPTVQTGRKSSTEELTACLKWLKLVNKGGVKIDESDVQNVKEAVSPDTTGEY
jgi:hypothetical protein